MTDSSVFAMPMDGCIASPFGVRAGLVAKRTRNRSRHQRGRTHGINGCGCQRLFEHDAQLRSDEQLFDYELSELFFARAPLALVLPERSLRIRSDSHQTLR